jgi:hypothetical protein
LKTHLRVNADEGVSSVVEFFLQGDDNTLELGLGLLSDVGGHFADVGVVQGSVDLIQHEEGGWLVTAQIKDKDLFRAMRHKDMYCMKTQRVHVVNGMRDGKTKTVLKFARFTTRQASYADYHFLPLKYK